MVSIRSGRLFISRECTTIVLSGMSGLLLGSFGVSAGLTDTFRILFIGGGLRSE